MKVGFAVSDITPELGIYLTGYGRPERLADGGTLFVTNRGDNSISCFDAAPDGNIKLRETIPAGGDFPSDLIISADGKIIAVANFKSGDVTTPDGSVELKQAIALCP